jgi:hypothetical protein
LREFRVPAQARKKEMGEEPAVGGHGESWRRRGREVQARRDRQIT